tara:strand:- start:407 stop:1126 length:720 start_codon:yes stop_codon:yes gene_type:complete
MINSLIKILDFNYQRRKNKFLKDKLFNKVDIFFDIGAHTGDTINELLKTLNLNKIYAFEPSIKNYKELEKKINKIKKKNSRISTNLFLCGVGNKKENLYLNEIIDGVSNTFNNFNINSKYLKRKKFLFTYFGLKSFLKKRLLTKIITLSDFMNEQKINKIDLIKIDTEGYEYNVLLGLREKIKKVNFILFEHHFDNMLIKNYKFSDINELLLKNGFKKVFKIKMPFRKSFDYIYENTKW